MRIVKTEDQVESEVQNVNWGFPVEENDADFESYKRVEDMDEAELGKVAERLKTSPELLREIDSVIGELRSATHRDLAQIYMDQQ